MVEPQIAADLQGSGCEKPELDPCTLIRSSPDADWLGLENRRQERFQVHASRPIAIRGCGDPVAGPPAAWIHADILDISRGGLCLMVAGTAVPGTGVTLQLDLRPHPDFGVVLITCQVRWTRHTHGFTTLGIAFPEPLGRLPRLERERRRVRRDPNSSDSFAAARRSGL
jgi:hypothetical protein